MNATTNDAPDDRAAAGMARLRELGFVSPVTCSDCGGAVVPCHHTPTRVQIGWDHVTVPTTGYCAGLKTAATAGSQR